MVLFGTCIIESLAACLKASQFLLHHPDVTGFYTSNKIIGGKKTDQRCLVIGVRKKKKESELEEQWILPKVIEHGGYRHLVLGWCGGARNALPGQSESVHAHWPGTWTSRADRVRGRHLKGHRLLASRVPRTFPSERKGVWKRELDSHQSSARAIKHFRSSSCDLQSETPAELYNSLIKLST